MLVAFSLPRWPLLPILRARPANGIRKQLSCPWTHGVIRVVMPTAVHDNVVMGGSVHLRRLRDRPAWLLGAAGLAPAPAAIAATNELKGEYYTAPRVVGQYWPTRHNPNL